MSSCRTRSSALIVARTQLETSLFGLARLLNVDPHRTSNSPTRSSFFDTPTVRSDQTLEKAYAARPELRALHSRRSRRRAELRTAADERLPQGAFSGFWAEQGLTPDSVIPVYQYQAHLDVPLFTGGRIQAERAKADLAIRQLQQQETSCATASRWK